MIRFIHGADLHIDRAFEGVSSLSETIQKQLPSINQKILSRLVDTALAHEIDFLLLSGDTFHQPRPSLQIQHHFFQEMQRLKEADIPVYLIFGNHDYYEEERYWFDFPENVVLFTSETVATVQHTAKSNESYAISGFSYLHPWVKEHKANEFPARGSADYHIGMYHGDMTGENYAPFTLSELKSKGYDYWALGHIHLQKILSENPLVVYPGTPQGKTRKEQAPGIALVTLSKQNSSIELMDISEIKWQSQSISLKGITTQKEALQSIFEQVKNPLQRIIRVILTDTDGLPEDWLNKQEEAEILAYLNDRLSSFQPLQTITALEVQQTNQYKIPLPGTTAIIEQLLDNYQDPVLFQTAVSELTAHPIMAKLLDVPSFQKELLEETKKQIANEFQWED